GRETTQRPHQASPPCRRHATPYDPSAVDVLDPLAVEVHPVSVVTRKPLDLFGDTAIGAVALVKKGSHDGYASLRRHTGSPAELADDDSPRSIDQPRALKRSLARSTSRVARKLVGSHADRSVVASGGMSSGPKKVLRIRRTLYPYPSRRRDAAAGYS